jgi:hypothetical protein
MHEILHSYMPLTGLVPAARRCAHVYTQMLLPIISAVKLRAPLQLLQTDSPSNAGASEQARACSRIVTALHVAAKPLGSSRCASTHASHALNTAPQPPPRMKTQNAQPSSSSSSSSPPSSLSTASAGSAAGAGTSAEGCAMADVLAWPAALATCEQGAASGGEGVQKQAWPCCRWCWSRSAPTHVSGLHSFESGR